MSRSYLRDKYVKACWEHNITSRNPHHYDEKSKNSLSKLISRLCPSAWEYKQKGSRQGHQVNNEGRRIASGIVRAKLKEETKREIQQEQNGEDLFER